MYEGLGFNKVTSPRPDIAGLDGAHSAANASTDDPALRAPGLWNSTVLYSNIPFGIKLRK